MDETTSSIAKSADVRKGVIIEHPIQVGPRAEIHSGKVGRYLFVNIDTVIYGGVDIGRFCTFARHCQIGGDEHPMHYLSTSYFRISRDWFVNDPISRSADQLKHRPFHKKSRGGNNTIGNDVWVGAGAIVLRGVNIGDGAVVGAGSIVTKDVPPYAIVAGNPARVVRMRFGDETIVALLELKWWDLPVEKIVQLPMTDIHRSISIMREWKESEAT